jgi:hypothetical protein
MSMSKGPFTAMFLDLCPKTTYILLCQLHCLQNNFFLHDQSALELMHFSILFVLKEWRQRQQTHSILSCNVAASIPLPTSSRILFFQPGKTAGASSSPPHYTMHKNTKPINEINYKNNNNRNLD